MAMLDEDRDTRSPTIEERLQYIESLLEKLLEHMLDQKTQEKGSWSAKLHGKLD